MQDVVEAVSTKNLNYAYQVTSTSSISSPALDNISFSVINGDLLGVIGPNGAGKTTLFSCLLGILKDYQGEVKIFGQDIRKNISVLQVSCFFMAKPANSLQTMN